MRPGTPRRHAVLAAAALAPWLSACGPAGPATTPGPGTDPAAVTLFSTTARKGWFSETVYSPVQSFRGTVYFVFVDEDLIPCVGQVRDGRVSTARLSPRDEYRARDDGHHEFSIGVDRLGHIHVAGDMHNFPFAGASRVPGPWAQAAQLYWVSERPEDISRFEFVGDDPGRRIPGTGFSYGFFRIDRDGELFYAARALARAPYYSRGGRGLGLYRYCADSRRWEARGGSAPGPDTAHRVAVWEDSGVDGGSYQMFKADLQFDTANRMHLVVSLNHGNPPVAANYVLYACSEDSGRTFLRADGTRIDTLPLRVEHGPGQGDLVDGASEMSVGQAGLLLGGTGRPAVLYSVDGKACYAYWTGRAWSGRIPSPSGERARSVFDPFSGSPILAGGLGHTDRLYRLRGFPSPEAETLETGFRIRYLDFAHPVRKAADTIHGISWDPRTGEFRILRIRPPAAGRRSARGIQPHTRLP